MDVGDSNRIAIIGMACRVSGVDDPEQFWQAIADGRDTLRAVSDEQLRAKGITQRELDDVNYVRATRALHGIEDFDAAFFGIPPREASCMDPQQRVFLECCHEALEAGGYPPGASQLSVGVFAGSAISTYLLHHLLPNAASQTPNEVLYEHSRGNDKDYLTTVVSYRLNLSGPSMSINTACSSALLAVVQACKSLLNHDCDMALAGGVRIELPNGVGYTYRKGGILSADGRCCAFDAGAQGTVFADGAGVVLLKRLDEALAGCDHIYATIEGFATNNDGAAKAGYSSPGPQGQESVLREALAFAAIQPQSVGYIEAHGTGTVVGDPIEFCALSNVYPPASDGVPYCALGSAKANFGHLNTAAGIAGLIKAVQVLRHRMLPPQINFTRINPQISLQGSAFYIPTELGPWRSTGPRRAGVSSYGIGGSNAHVILQEPPEVAPVPNERRPQLLVLSAKTASALDDQLLRLRQHLILHPELSLAEVAFTLQRRRRHYAHRFACVCHDLAATVQALSMDPAVTRLHAPADLDEHGRALLVLGRQWCAGEAVDWSALDTQGARCVPLPTYPFQRIRHWVDVDAKPQPRADAAAQIKHADISHWFYAPSWKLVPAAGTRHHPMIRERVLLLCDEFSEPLAQALRQQGNPIVEVRPGAGFARNGSGFEVNPRVGADWQRLVDELRAAQIRPSRLIFAWGMEPARVPGTSAHSEWLQVNTALVALLHLVQTLTSADLMSGAQLRIVTANAARIIGNERIRPEHAARVGACRVIADELHYLACGCIDVDADAGGIWPAVLRELGMPVAQRLVALRNERRWVEHFEPVVLSAVHDRAPLREGATYLVTGGLGGVGRAVMSWLCSMPGVKVAVLGRQELPAQAQWRASLDSPQTVQRVRSDLEFLMQLQAAGAQVLPVSADVTDAEAVERAIEAVCQRFGPIDGVFHLAGRSSNETLGAKSASSIEQVLAPKVQGICNLDRALLTQRPQFVVLFSSLAAITGGIKQFEYSAANAFLDAFAQRASDVGPSRWVSINWDAWQAGMAADIVVPEHLRHLKARALQNAMTAGEGIEALSRVLATREVQLIVSTRAIATRSVAANRAALSTEVSVVAQDRLQSVLETNSAPVAGATERKLALIWSSLSGYQNIGRHDNFFALGGDSLLATKVVAAINSELGVDIGVRDFLESKDIEDLARLIDALSTDDLARSGEELQEHVW